MRYGGLLTIIEPTESFAVCEHCEVVYQDDAPQHGALECPNDCGCALRRGLTRKQAKALLDCDQKELLE